MSRQIPLAAAPLAALIALAAVILPLTAHAATDPAATPTAGAASVSDVMFRYVPPHGTAVRSVSLRGSFNGWGETPMTRGPDESWSVTIQLAPGEYQYKYFVNGEWPPDMGAGPGGAPIDAEADGYVPDGYGGRNAVRVVSGGVAHAEHRDPAEIEARMELMKKRIGGASIEIYPVILGNEANVRIAQLVAVMLERANVKDIRVNETPFNVSAVSDVWTNSAVFGDFIRARGIETDYALLGEFRQRPGGGVEVRGIVVDAAGRPVWVDSQIIGGRFDPMRGTLVLAQRLRTQLGLPDPEREDAPEGRWMAFWRKDSGVPEKAELAAMEERLQGMRSRFGDARVIVYPILQSDALNREGAQALVDLLAERNICRASVAGNEVHVALVPNPNEQRRLWDMARGFRTHVRQSGIDADYAIFAEYMLNPEARRVHAVHFVICDAAGEWVVVDLQNSHHPDFQRIGPETVDCCNRLVATRIESYLAAR